MFEFGFAFGTPSWWVPMFVASLFRTLMLHWLPINFEKCFGIFLMLFDTFPLSRMQPAKPTTNIVFKWIYMFLHTNKNMTFYYVCDFFATCFFFGDFGHRSAFTLVFPLASNSIFSGNHVFICFGKVFLQYGQAQFCWPMSIQPKW